MSRATLLALAAASLVVASCTRRADSAAKVPPVPVVVTAAVQKDVPVLLRAIGSVEPLATVSIKPQVGGVILTVHFKEGADVRAGELLFSIDPRPYEAALRGAQSTLARDQAQAQNAQAESRRAEDLLGQGILAKEQYDQVRANTQALDATVRGDEAALENARLQLGYCEIRSPLDGRAGSVLVHQGNLVKAIDGGPLVVINRIDPVYVTFSIPEARLAELKQAMSARRLVVEAQAQGDATAPVRGELSFVDNAVDRDTGTIKLKATFPNRERRLWPGQFVTTRLTLAVRTAATVVPSQALQNGQAGTFVFVVKPDQTAESRPVVVAQDEAGEAVVQKGLAPGETVVTDGQLRLVPGAKVEARSAAPSRGATP
jgi:multidrug efflux system membrane fusion protein